MRPLADLVRLSGKNGGVIPNEIPAHYVEWAISFHRHDRIVASFDYSLKKPMNQYPAPKKVRPTVIYQ